MPIFSQNVDQIKIKIKNLIPPGAEHFVRFKKNAGNFFCKIRMTIYSYWKVFDIGDN